MPKWDFLKCKASGEDEEPLMKFSFEELAHVLDKEPGEKEVTPKAEKPKEAPVDTRPSWTVAPGFVNKTWRATSIKMYHGPFDQMLADVTEGTVDYWTIDPPFNILEDDKIDKAALDSLIGLIDKHSKPTAVGDIYVSRDGDGTTYHDWVERFKTSKIFEVKDKYYVRCSNKVSSRGVQLPALSTVQEVLLFGPKTFAIKDLHVNFEDPRIDWATNFMEEYAIYCLHDCML